MNRKYKSLNCLCVLGRLQELKALNLEEFIYDRQEEEMDLSDDDDAAGPSNKKLRIGCSPSESSMNSLREENDNLKCQLEAYKNEVDVLKSENRQEIKEKTTVIDTMQKTMNGIQQQLVSLSQQRIKDEQTIKELEEKVRNGLAEEESEENLSSGEATSRPSDREARFIGLMCTFLTVHPFGASVDYIWSYLHQLDPTVRTNEVETLLTQYPTVFRMEISGVGASIERKWTFSALGVPDQ